MKNSRKRAYVKLVTNSKDYQKLEHKASLILQKIFGCKNLVTVYKPEEVLNPNKAACVAMCMFNLSKTLMRDFLYNYLKKKNGRNAKLLLMDLDSVTYEIETTDVYEDFHKDK